MRLDVQLLVDDLVRDAAGEITEAQRDTALTLAVARYSADRPRERVAAVVAAGGPQLPMPAGWTEACRVAWVEWPIGQNPPAPARHLVHRTLTGDAILLDVDLAAGDTAHVHYTDGHVLTDAEDTIPGVHREALAAYAASLLFDQLASLAARNSDPTILVDGADRKSQAQEYASRARACRKRYADVLGLQEGPAVKPAGAAVAWPAKTRFPGAGAVRR